MATNLPSNEFNTELIHKFQSLLAGQYWKARGDEGKYIKKDYVLLIQSIAWVDNKPHTITLRPHPFVYRIYGVESHSFLVDDFLSKFDFEPDFQAIRARELAEIQGELNALQEELVTTQSDPEKMNLIVQAALGDDANNLPAISNNAAQQFISGGLMGAIGTGITAESIETYKLAANREHKIASIKADWIKNQTSKMGETIARMTPFYEELAACALAQTEDVRNYVDKLTKGIESLDLYVGRNVEVITIKQGASASADVPLSLIQKKLIIDEELSVYFDLREWFDFKNIPLFLEQLSTNTDLVNQLFPTPRCVLVMATTRRNVQYHDPYLNAVLNQKNHSVFLMVRDGENIYQVYSPVESHLGSSRLFPSKNDQEAIFKGFDGSQITFNDLAYTKALNLHELHALHYKRFLILLCGLDHRLNLFGKFYEGPKTMHFVSMSFQEKHLNFIHDDDGEGMLPNPDIRPSVHEWVKEMNKYLRPGSRFFAQWLAFINTENCPVMFKRSQFLREKDRYLINHPVKDYSVEKIQRDGLDYIVKIEAKSDHSRRDPFLARVLIQPSDLEYGIKGLCIDAVEPEDLEYYIHNRGERENHLEYIRMFKRLLEYIKDERAYEKPTRQYLMDTLNQNNIGLPGDRENLIKKSIIAWRAENNGKELPVGDLATSKSLQPILDHIYHLANTETTNVDEVKLLIADEGVSPVRISRNGKGLLVVYATLRAEQVDNILEESPFLNRYVLEAINGKYKIKSSSLDILREKSASETVLYEVEDVAQYIKTSIFVSNSVKQRILNTLSESKAVFERYSRPVSEEEFSRELNTYLNIRYKNSKKTVEEPLIYVPIGVYKYKSYIKDRNEVALIYLAANYSALLYQIAPNDECKNKLKAEFISLYANKAAAIELHEKRNVVDTNPQQLWKIKVSAMHDDSPEKSSFAYINKAKHSFTYSQFVDEIILNLDLKSSEHWHIESTLMSDGRFILDDILNVIPPADFEPYRVFIYGASFKTEKAFFVTKCSDHLYEIDRSFLVSNTQRRYSDSYKEYFTTRQELKNFIESNGMVFNDCKTVTYDGCSVDIYEQEASKDESQ